MSIKANHRKRNATMPGSIPKANPFETMVLKRKHITLNQDRSSKRPGLLQKIANDKHSQTLGKEYTLMHKTNRFVDERAHIKRATNSSKRVQIKEMFNLKLTHRGQRLHEIANFDHVPDDFDEDEDGVLAASFTSETHFGGGSHNQRYAKDRKTAIEEMIAHSKRQKVERQQENDELCEMRQKLDEELKLMMPRIATNIRKDVEPNVPDGYDRVLREMVFEPRGSPTRKRNCWETTEQEDEKGQQMGVNHEPDGELKQDKLNVTYPNHSSNPRMIDVPTEYNQFVELMDSNTLMDERIRLIMDMIHTLQNKSFLHKSRWSVLFAYTLKYMDDRFTHSSNSSITVEFQTLHLLTPLLHDIAQNDPSGAGKAYLELLKERYSEFQKRPQRYPGMGTLIILKLFPSLFSPFERNCSILSPALVFMGEMLTRCEVRNRRHITRGLLLVTTVLECVERSKRFLPSVVAFLSGVLVQACPEGSLTAITSIGQPFKGTSTLLLYTASKDFNDRNDGIQLTERDLLSVEVNPSFKIRAVACSVSLVTALCTQLQQIETVSILAEHFLQLLCIIQQSPYPSSVQEIFQNATETLTKLANRSLPYLVKVAKQPKPLPLLEPKNDPEPVRVQRRKLSQKVKQMTRAAKRELRLDNEFVAKLRHKVRMESDRERSRKVRQIFSHISSEQACTKSIQKKNKMLGKAI